MTESAPSEAATFEQPDREAAQLAARAAAPVVERIEAVGTLEPATRGASYALLSSLADNKYALGRRYAEWCTGAPMLESAVAAAAMAQDELGHARSFYPLLRGFPEASAADTVEELGWQQRPTSAVACLGRPFEAWAAFIAANLLVDTALSTLLEAATNSPYELLRQRARKILQEEASHWVHAQGWVARIAADKQGRPGLVLRLRAAWDDALTWFGQADDPVLGQLERAGLLASGPDALRARLRARVEPVLAAAGLLEDLRRCSLPWDRWDAGARTLRPDG
jgi:phenylacetate-CoA oxygenase PaaI subunit